MKSEVSMPVVIVVVVLVVLVAGFAFWRFQKGEAPTLDAKGNPTIPQAQRKGYDAMSALYKGGAGVMPPKTLPSR